MAKRNGSGNHGCLYYLIGWPLAIILGLAALMLLKELVVTFWWQILLVVAVILLIVFWVRSAKRKKLAAEAAEEQRRIAEADAARAERAAAFRRILDGIPEAPILPDLSVTKTGKLPLYDMPDYTISNITQRTNTSKIRSFVVIDTETNGVNIQGGRILELSAIRFEDFHPVAAWSTLVNPCAPIPADASAINHITDDMVKDAPLLGQVTEDFLRFVGNSPIVGYNVSFDLRFLYARGVDLLQEKRKVFDAYALSRKVFSGELNRFRLTDVAEHCGFCCDDAHRALADCLMTGMVFRRCVLNITGESE